MSQLPEQTDVLIIGYGPVGATLACLLGRHGVDTLVVDRATGPFPLPRAIALDNEALRILQMAGLPEGAIDTLAIPLVQMHSPFTGEFMHADTTGTVDGHPRLVTFHQPQLEQVLRDQVDGHDDVTTALGCELVGLEQNERDVLATLRDAGGVERQVRARYLVGADGARSWIRQAIGLEFTGRSYAEDWLIVDAVNTPRPIDHVEFLCNPDRPVAHMVAPNGRERWEFMLQPTECARDMEKPEKIRELLSPWGRPEDMHIERKAVYRFHARCAKRFQSGRVFLVGDAAHITPPFAGQGLCAGLRDVANLSWKLAWVLAGRAAPGILESYSRERQPHAQSMINLAVLLGRMIMPTSRPTAWLTHGAVQLLRLVPKTRAFFDDLEMKPRNRFSEGLFLKSSGETRVVCGDHLPQGLLRDAQGATHLSDDVLGNHLTLIGLGHDPADHLDADTAAAWSRAGGKTLQICHRGQRLYRGEELRGWEDLENVLVPGIAPMGRLIVVRPDRTIMHEGALADADRVVRETIARLGTPDSTTHAVRAAHA